MFRQPRRSISPEIAQALAIEAFTFLAQDEEKLNAFLMQSGLDAGDLREASRSNYFFEAVMDFVTGSDEVILAFSEKTGHVPQDAVHVAQYFKREENS